MLLSFGSRLKRWLAAFLGGVFVALGAYRAIFAFLGWIGKGDVLLDLPWVLSHPATGVILLVVGISWLAYLVKKPFSGGQVLYGPDGKPFPGSLQPVFPVFLGATVLAIVATAVTFVAFPARGIVQGYPNQGEAADEPRRLSETEQLRMASLLRENAGRTVIICVPSIRNERERRERSDFASDIAAAFRRAEWKVVYHDPCPGTGDIDYSGILFVYFAGNPPDSWPSFEILESAFNVVGIGYTITGLSLMSAYSDGGTTGDPLIYVGEKD